MAIYLDNAATTPLDPEALNAMMPYLREEFGNSSSAHSRGRAAKNALDHARDVIATALGAQFEEIIFTSGGSESDNLALIGTAMTGKNRGDHLITTKIEHNAVLQTAKFLETQGFSVTYAPVDSMGIVDPEEIRHALTPRTILVSVMHANNEIGTIQPIAEIAKITREAGIPLHTDAVQTVGHIPTGVEDLGVNLLSLSAHKFSGPKGAGALYIRAGTRISPMLHGGGHERGLRAGTHNVAGIVGMAKALELSLEHREEYSARIKSLRDELLQGILDTIPDISLNGHPEKRLHGNLNLRFAGLEAESLLIALDREGIEVSAGSACSSGSLEPSHVLRAIGLTLIEAQQCLRITLGRCNTKQEIAIVLEKLPAIVDRLRGRTKQESPKSLQHTKP